ncbi:DNA primase [Candidatus Kaiserbacteria bacterium RIFCSPLOWO2_01_FULL_55_19]|uniref:DNA primase n=1 Tax=Candidatus Kaiserbacteria bacterium RIFCSPLOWO2_01_FULL_55_19 TaxID=1798516 RepID=A0A1F6ESM3_9BACT|nr:MAG: DNA primase [Candidatus Kaiserbacteria bacterium RIFCSPLOWO2_01_FULL_55_19]
MATDTVAQIKERLSIQDIIAPYVKLRRAGRSMVGLCPFHKEKTPSFHVSLERGSWHCFGCGQGGDGFSFIEKVEGVDFKGALKILAEKAGVQITSIYGSGGKEDASKKERLRALMSRAGEWYAGNLKGSSAEAYAKQRGLMPDTIQAWRIGFAPEAWRTLLEALTAEGFSIEEMLGAGLIKEADGKPGTYYDRFRNRLMFPIRDSAGRVVAFTGRALAKDDPAKYLNSPETELYHKSEILFGVDFAKDAIRVRKFTMLVEGQMDVILAHQAGFQNAVALSGTALTERHLALMKRYSENLMLVLDADPAGLSATARSATLALHAGLRVKAARLPKGKDPAELISEDPKEFKKRITGAKPIVDFFLAELAGQESDPHRLLRTAESIVLPLISAMPSPMEREHFMQSTARALGLSSEAVQESIKRLPKFPEAAGSMESVPKPVTAARAPSEIRRGQLVAVIHAYPDTLLAERVKAEYFRITGVQELPPSIPPESALFYAEQSFGENPGEEGADELLRAFEEAVIREAYQEGVNKLRRAEAAGDADAVVRAQAACAALSARLAGIHPAG